MPLKTNEERKSAADYLLEQHRTVVQSGLYVKALKSGQDPVAAVEREPLQLYEYLSEPLEDEPSREFLRLLSALLTPRSLKVPSSVNLSCAVSSLERGAETYMVPRTIILLVAMVVVGTAIIFQACVCLGKLKSPRLDVYWIVLVCLGGPTVIVHSTTNMDVMNLFIDEKVFLDVIDQVVAANNDKDVVQAAVRAFVVDMLSMWQKVRTRSCLP